MSRPELQALIASLNSSILNMQDQANYWLDSKEQLVMESEMHNKMIASLVRMSINLFFSIINTTCLSTTTLFANVGYICSTKACTSHSRSKKEKVIL
jgi:hypothetical protein